MATSNPSARATPVPRTQAPRLKLVRVIARLNIGGPARQVAVLMQGLDPDRFSSVLVTGRPSPREGDLAPLLASTARAVTIPELGRALHPIRDVIAWAKLCRILWQEHPDLLHTHTAKAGALGRLAGLWYNVLQRLRGRRNRIAMVHTFHGHVLSGYFGRLSSAVFLVIERWLARHTDVLIAVSPAVREDLLRRGIGRPARIRVVPLGLDLSELSAVRGYRMALRKELGLPEQAALVGIVGRLVPIKQHDLFLRVAQRLTSVRSDVHCAIVGDGELYEPLRRQVRRLGLDDRVRFLGWRVDLASVYADLDCVCLTSRNEGTPVSLIEAMAAGKPVVATAVGGVPDLLGAIVERGRAYDIAERGILVQLTNGEAGMTAAIERLLGDRVLGGQLARAGRAFVCQRLSAERLTADLTELYQALSERGKG